MSEKVLPLFFNISITPWLPDPNNLHPLTTSSNDESLIDLKGEQLLFPTTITL